MTADQFLSRAASLLTERGKQYDKDGGRSGPKIAAAFNAITGKNLTAAEVYLLFQITKDVRQWSCYDYHQDSAEDSVSFAALKAEALADSGLKTMDDIVQKYQDDMLATRLKIEENRLKYDYVPKDLMTIEELERSEKGKSDANVRVTATHRES